MDTIEELPVVTPSGVADTNQAALCKVCQRARTRIQPDLTGRVLACALCEHVDATVAALHGAKLLTPLNRNDHGDDDVLLHRIFRGDVHGTATAVFQEFHRAAVRAMHEKAQADGVRHLAVRYPGGGPWGLLVDWARWQEHFPPSTAASVEAYLRYLAKVHPWALLVERRLSEPGWLAGLVEGAARD